MKNLSFSPYSFLLLLLILLVTVIIIETLALAADQRSKVTSANGIYGPILAYQLDSIKKKDLVDKLKKKLLSLTKDGNITVFLYTSPECLMREPWRSIMVTLIDRRVMKLVCIDEIHLFVMFGIPLGRSSPC